MNSLKAKLLLDNVLVGVISFAEHSFTDYSFERLMTFQYAITCIQR